MQLNRSCLLDLLPKYFVVRRLRISLQYAPSSLLAFRKNLRRNHFPLNCMNTYRASEVVHRLPGSPSGSSPKEAVNNFAAAAMNWTLIFTFEYFASGSRTNMHGRFRSTILSQTSRREPDGKTSATHTQVPTFDVSYYTTCGPNAAPEYYEL